jgi:hypothetical protein
MDHFLQIPLEPKHKVAPEWTTVLSLIENQQPRQALMSGQSIDAVAAAHGVDVDHYMGSLELFASGGGQSKTVVVAEFYISMLSKLPGHKITRQNKAFFCQEYAACTWKGFSETSFAWGAVPLPTTRFP